MSVYDLLDHPDFQYRPGTIVIRVANFNGDDALCTAGQVVDNYAEGRVRVWWVDGHDSMCWPQDLFEVTRKYIMSERKKINILTIGGSVRCRPQFLVEQRIRQ